MTVFGSARRTANDAPATPAPAAQQQGETAPAAAPAAGGSPRRKPPRWVAVIPEAVIIGICVVLWLISGDWHSSAGGPGPSFYPRLLIALLALAMVIRVIQQLRGGSADDDQALPEDHIPEQVEIDSSLIDQRKVWVAVAMAVGYVFGTIYLGWVIATFLLVILFLALSGKRNPLITIPVALAFSVGMAYVFVSIVYISLPTGRGVFDDASVWLFELIGAY